MNLEIVFLIAMVIGCGYFFILGELTYEDLKEAQGEHASYTEDLTTKAVMSYATSLLCCFSGILCIIRLLN